MNPESKVCAICMRLRSLLENPYHYSGAVLARVTVCIATMLWSAIVLVKQDALAQWLGAALFSLAQYENPIAAGFFMVAGVGLYRIIYQSKPIRVGACIYGLMALLWSYTFITLILAVYTGETTLRPGQVSAIFVVTVLALFAFITNPKRHGS